MLSEELMLSEGFTSDFRTRKKMKLGTKLKFIKGKFKGRDNIHGDVYGAKWGQILFRILEMKDNGKWRVEIKHPDVSWGVMAAGKEFDTREKAAKYLSDYLAKTKKKQNK